MRSSIRAYPDCRLVRVVDADTVSIDVCLGFYVTVRETFRLAGLDAPEKHTPEGLAAKHFVESWFERHPTFNVVSAKGREQDKYGRWLAVVSSTPPYSVSLNDALVAAGHARLYDGGQR